MAALEQGVDKGRRRLPAEDQQAEQSERQDRWDKPVSLIGVGKADEVF